jgi:hypothetical protein
MPANPIDLWPFGNDGILNSGILQYWIKIKNSLGGKIKMNIIVLKINFPAFHPSTIPCSNRDLKYFKI